MSDEKLKPCPFCGGDTHLHYDPKSEMFGPVSEHARGCPIMNFDLVDYSDEHVAVTRWNTRSAQAPAGDGWVIVPGEPTAAMIDAAVKASGDGMGMIGAAVRRYFARDYRAMLSALAQTPRKDEDQ